LQNSILKNKISSQIFRPFEFELYKKWFDWITKAHDCKLDIIIYLKTNPETCIARFKKRARPEEINRLSSDYVTNLHNFHELWLNSSSTDYYRPQNVIVINADQSADKVYEEIERKLLEILKSLIK
jgi:thymidine kinase